MNKEPKLSKEVEEKFDKEFRKICEWCGFGKGFLKDKEIKQFLAEEIEKQKEKIIKIGDEMKKSEKHNVVDEGIVCFNLAIKEYQDKIDKL